MSFSLCEVACPFFFPQPNFKKEKAACQLIRVGGKKLEQLPDDLSTRDIFFSSIIIYRNLTVSF